MSDLRTPRGAALPMVLLAIAMASALAVGGAYVARQLAASARVAQRGLELQPAAERMLVDAIAMWDSAARTEQPVGSVAPLPSPSIPAPRLDGWVTRVNERMYWLVAEAESRDRPAIRRRIGVLIRVSGGVPALVLLRPWSELP